MPGWGTLCWSCAVIVVVGCGDDVGVARDAGATDAASDGRVDASASDPWPTAMPAPPSLLPCASGWLEAPGAEGQPSHCEPWESMPVDCTGDRAPFAGEGCAAIGPPCPAGEWAEDLPADALVVYVRASATGGDGTIAAPFGTIAEAVAAVAAAGGGVIALAKGTYAEQAELAGDGITLHGACIAETIVRSSEPGSSRGTIWVRGTNNAIRNLQVTGDRPGITIAALPDGPRTLTVDRVLVRDVEDGALIALGPIEANVQSFVARDVAPRSTDGMYGNGIDVEVGATLVLERAVIERAAAMGVFVDQPGTEARIADVVVLEPGLRGVAVQNDAGLEASEVAVFGGGDAAFFVHDARATFADVLARGEGSSAAGGILAQAGSAIDVTRAGLVDVASIGLYADASEARATDLVVRDVRVDVADGRFGRAIGLQHGATATVERAWLSANHNGGVVAFSAGTTVQVSDLHVLDTDSDGTGYYGEAIAAYEGATVSVQRAVLARSSYTAVIAHGAASRIVLEDSAVESTRAAGCAAEGCVNAAGHGVVAALGGSIEATRFRVSGSALANVQIADGGAIDLHHGVVESAPVGVNVQVDGYDLARLMDDVIYRDHEVQLDTTSLPVPTPGIR